MIAALTFMETVLPFLNEELIEVESNQKYWIKKKPTTAPNMKMINVL